jgi:nucleotidyltransferase substrate binding protein (TIGR01987 family)
MEVKNLRWAQRFSNYKRALERLSKLVQLEKKQGELSEVEQEALIQRFEYTHELAWKVLKDFLLHRFGISAKGPKDSAKEAFAAGVIENGETWLDMIEKRNLTVHTYNEDVALQVVEAVLKDYFPLFAALEIRLAVELSNED